MHEADHDECLVVSGDPLLEAALATVLPPLDRPSGDYSDIGVPSDYDRVLRRYDALS